MQRSVTTPIKPRGRKVRILATLGPASNSPSMIRELSEAGADAFRINMSHGTQAEKVALVEAIRARRFWILSHEDMRQMPIERMQRAADGVNPSLAIQPS